MSRCWSLSLLLLAPTAAVADCDYVREHAIEAGFAAASDRSGGVTVDLRNAQGVAYEAWDAELNRLYRALLAEVPKPSDRDALRRAQRAWLGFHAAEGDWQESDAMHGREGTSGPLNIGGSALLRLKQRVCDLHLARAVRQTAPSE